jgi:two-component system sensor histidine kinase ResE
VEQVLVALLDNAVKYASDDGRVTLSAKRENGVLIISVCNTGGIAEEHLPHLFERFYKADTAHAEQGTGLGLAIAREIMLLLGERIWAENSGGEACFCFTLGEWTITT